ncbi:MAG TPA: FAD-dependent monooxygenase [Streptosporangiaceae bacterium]
MPEVAIVGAGIAGLTLAAALDRQGLPCTVFEQAAEPAGTGAGVQIAPNASRLLHRLGLARRLREVAVRPVATEFRRWSDGRLIARTTLGAECERLYGAPYYTIHRADLRDALTSLVGDPVVCFGQRLTGARDASDHVVLEFTDGSSHQARMVVGADGIRSVVRAMLIADQPVFSGLGVYRGLVPAAAVPELAVEPAVRLWLGPGRHLVCYPVSAGRSISFAATAPCQTPGRESWVAEGAAEDLVGAFTGWSQTVQRLVGCAQSIRHWMLYDRDPLRHLSMSRMALIGDAAHPMLPFGAQGANQAIEDAMALARCLTLGLARSLGLRGTRLTAEAVRRYETGRAARTARLQRQARWNVRGMHLPDGAAQRSRDKALSTGTDLRHLGWLYGYDAEGECLR